MPSNINNPNHKWSVRDCKCIVFDQHFLTNLKETIQFEYKTEKEIKSTIKQKILNNDFLHYKHNIKEPKGTKSRDRISKDHERAFKHFHLHILPNIKLTYPNLTKNELKEKVYQNYFIE